MPQNATGSAHGCDAGRSNGGNASAGNGMTAAFEIEDIIGSSL
jgi:hypothetical protein